MLIPYGTDAPVYYWPLATVGLIVANVVAFVGVMNGTLPVIDDWVLWTEHAAVIEARQQLRDEQQLHDAQKQFAFYLQNGNAVAALLLYEKMKDTGVGLSLAYSEFLTLIHALHTAKCWKDSAPLMAACIERFPDQADPVRVKLAQICVVELERPGKALDLLADVDSSKLPEKHAVLAQRVAAKARQMQNEGVVEFDDDTW